MLDLLRKKQEQMSGMRGAKESAQGSLSPRAGHALARAGLGAARQGSYDSPQGGYQGQQEQRGEQYAQRGLEGMQKQQMDRSRGMDRFGGMNRGRSEQAKAMQEARGIGRYGEEGEMGGMMGMKDSMEEAMLAREEGGYADSGEAQVEQFAAMQAAQEQMGNPAVDPRMNYRRAMQRAQRQQMFGQRGERDEVQDSGRDWYRRKMAQRREEQGGERWGGRGAGQYRQMMMERARRRMMRERQKQGQQQQYNPFMQSNRY